ncbi:MAG: guanylate kinase [Verrucomicrobia bacterium TMED56]|jgi:guanylate kinase|nr:MAG: guanylate kinase [Verrucomicrobia bacterium TMED56]|tara:strand:- start:104 stop:688 length:585 start_codon:yes stop_codon:yes gene_type:complete
MALLIVISGPAGVGKTTICNRLLDEFKNSLSRVVTTTTRAPRIGETDGIDYFFISKNNFEENLQNGNFLEHEIIHENYYGTSKSAVTQKLQDGKDILINIDVKGAESLRKKICDFQNLGQKLISIFIKPNSIEELKARLLNRGSDNLKEISKRLKTAEHELQYACHFDHTVLSSQKENDYQTIRSIYLKSSQES